MSSENLEQNLREQATEKVSVANDLFVINSKKKRDKNDTQNADNKLLSTSKKDDLVAVGSQNSKLNIPAVTSRNTSAKVIARNIFPSTSMENSSDSETHVKTDGKKKERHISRQRKRKLTENRIRSRRCLNDSDLPNASDSANDSAPCVVTSDDCRTPEKKQKASDVESGKKEGFEKVLHDMEDEIEDVLLETAEKNNLTAVNVKNILRHIVTNEYVLAMVRNTMKAGGDSNSGDLEEAVYEPKLTRSKVKELREKHAVLPWPMSSPVKQYTQPVSHKLLEQEFPEDSSSDEEYKPNEEEEECRSEDDDKLSKTSELSSPISKRIEETEVNNQDDFQPLVIALPETPTSENCSRTDEADKIALRTRSKLPLNDLPLEVIEANFAAPDITVDMYDTECDNEDWLKFLSDFAKPLDSNVIAEQPDEDADDPEYNFLEEDDIPDEWDLRCDRAVKVSKKEYNELFAELLDAAEQEFNDVDYEEGEDKSEGDKDVENSCAAETNVSSNVREWFSTEERMQLEQQMRMHVQLLTQSYLLSHGINQLKDVSESSELFLKELKMFADRELASGEKSAFYASNLDEALKITETYPSLLPTLAPIKLLTKHVKGTPIIHCTKVKEIIARSKAFIYPELLPVCGYQLYLSPKPKVTFTNAEDNLIALGLEQFTPLGNPVHWIQNLLVPVKTEQQIRFRIKNCKSSKLINSSNPIRYYFLNKKAPPIPRFIKPFNSEHWDLPCDLPPEVLPKWMVPYSKKFPAITPAPAVQVVSPQVPKIPERRRYTPILPRNHFSPMKQISPILKKYVQRRRPFSSIQITPVTAVVRPLNFAKKPHQRPLASKPLFETISEPSINSVPATPQVMHVSNGNIDQLNVPPVTVTVTSPIILHTTVSISVNLDANEKEEDKINEKNSQTELNSILQKSSNGKPEVSDEQKLEVSGKSKTNSQDSYSSKCPITECPEISANGNTENEANIEIDACEDVDDEIVDDEQDLAALMAASSTISKKQHPLIKKKNKHQRDLESTLALLSPKVESDPKVTVNDIPIVGTAHAIKQEVIVEEETDTNSVVMCMKLRDNSKQDFNVKCSPVIYNIKTLCESDNENDETNQFMQEAKHESETEINNFDELSIFGEYIVAKIRKMPNLQLQITAQNRILNMLVEMELQNSSLCSPSTSANSFCTQRKLHKQDTVLNEPLSQNASSVSSSVINFESEIETNNFDKLPIFGEYIVAEIRKMPNPQLQITAQNRILNMLFKIELQNYSLCSPSTSANSFCTQRELRKQDTVLNEPWSQNAISVSSNVINYSNLKITSVRSVSAM